MKKCTKCQKSKKESEFYGIQGDCKECYKKQVKKNRAKNIGHYKNYDKHRQKYSLKRILGHRYAMMKMSIEGRNSHGRSCEGKELLNRTEYQKWCKDNNKNFLIIYSIWKKSGFQRKLTPSIDRKDNELGYVSENMQWINLSENIKKNANGRIGAKRNEKGQFLKINQLKK